MTSIAEYNNNPGNLKPPPKVKYQGQIGVDERGFAIFENAEAGRNALVQDILIKQKRGLNTPESFIDRYAPAGDENPDEARENYKIKLAQHLGLKSTSDPFPKGSEQKIADLIASFESGQPVGGQSKQKSGQQDYDKIFGVGEPTESQRLIEEGFGETTTTEGGEKSDSSVRDAGLYGAAAGLLAGQVAKKTTLPTSAEFDRATKNLKSAERNLNEIKNQVAKHGNLPDLELEFKKAQGAYAAAEAELAQATDELKSARAARTAPVSAAPEPGLTPTPDQQARGIQGTTKDTGITGRASQTTYNERTAQIARNERAQRAALQGLQRQGIIDPSKAYALTEGISASTPSGVLVPPGEAAVSQAKLEAELAPYEQKAAQAKQARVQAGEEKRAASQAVKKAERGAEQVGRAQSKVNIRAQELADAPPGIKGPLGKTGAFTAKNAPRVLGVLGGAATGMSAMEAWNRLQAGDTKGAVIPTLEMAFGLASMVPPWHPFAAAIRGAGMLGSAGLAAYEAYNYAKDKKPEYAGHVGYEAP